MGNTHTRKRRTRRTAAVLAALGALVASSGVALLVTATPASAATKVPICHATNSDSNPYTFILVDDDSKKFVAHLAHRNEPNKTWKTDGSFDGQDHSAGDPKPDIIGDYMDGDQLVEMDGEVTSGRCNSEVEVPNDVLTNATVAFTDPNCANGNIAGFTPSGANADFAITDGVAQPGQSITVTATAQDGYYFMFGDDPVVELDFTHQYPAAELNCTRVLPPEEGGTVVRPPKQGTTTVTTPTVVSAGLGAEPVDQRSEQALGLVFGGMVLLVAAGGVSLRRRS